MTGQTIVVAHYPTRITMHNIQNGREEHVLPVEPAPNGLDRRITGLWWFKKEHQPDKHAMPDMFRRGNVVVCMRRAAHTVLLSFVIYLISPLARFSTVYHEIAAAA